MRLFQTIGAFSAMLAPLAAQPAPRLVWQPVQEYFIHRDETQQIAAGTKRLNSFTNYTHLGSDFGFHGPAEHEIEWLTDQIVVRLGQEPDAWAGMWHSLAGQARDPQRVMDFTRVYPEQIVATLQPRVSAVMIEAAGRGNLKLEIKSPSQEVLWTEMIEVDHDAFEMHVSPVPSQALRNAKLIVWTAEPGSDLRINGLRLGMEMPPVPQDLQVFLASYAKLARCYGADTGFVRDRAHIEEGAFESLPATGMHVLATAAAAHPCVGVVAQEYAREVLSRTQDAVRRLKTAHGLLPHFVQRHEGVYRIHPGTEYSTVDTAIYLQSLMLAAVMLQDHEAEREALRMIEQIDFHRLRLPNGHLSHGFADDGETVLPHGWQDWGGETALVMLTEAMVHPQHRPPPMRHPGKAWQGAGFITELQSLFHPDFDSDVPDAHDGVRWLSVRRAMLGAQRAYIPHRWPQSPAARLGIYGLSAGENAFGNGYHVGGVDLPDQRLIHPHYLLMSATLRPDTAEVYRLLGHMEKAGYLPPWGLVENVLVDGSSYLPMEGALNAGFEALAACHLLAQHRGVPDVIHAASLRCTAMRRAIRLFYPPASKKQAAMIEPPPDR